MEAKMIITTEMLKNASDYIPLMERQMLLEDIARVCIAKVKMDVILTGDKEATSMPERYQENRVMTKMCLMGVLALKYLHVDYDGEDRNIQMPANIYDMWAGSHVVNQIEKLRSDKEVGDKAYRVLKGYRDFCADLYREIEILLGHQNDVVYRLMDAMNVAAKQAAYETIAPAIEAEKAETGHGKKPEEMTKEEREKMTEETMTKLDEGIDKLIAMREKLRKAKEAAGSAH